MIRHKEIGFKLRYSLYLTKVFLIWIISLLDINAMYGQMINEGQKTKVGHTEIPFEYVNGFIVVDIIFNKVLPLKFILDTGAENTILLKREIAEIMKLTYRKRIKLIGSDLSQEVYAQVSNAAFIQVTNLPLSKQNIIVLEEDYLYLEEYIGKPIYGILGAAFFKDRIVKIDYKKEIITVIDPVVFKPSRYKKFKAYDIELIGRKPYITTTTEVNAGQDVKTRLLLDTGAGVSAILHNNTDTALYHKGKFIKGNLGKGLGGNIEGYIGTIQSMKIGDFRIDQMVCSFQSIDDAIISENKLIRHGLLGNLLLERFDIILDYYHKKVYLKPHKDFNKAFVYDRSGLTIFSFGPDLRRYYVKYVALNSPAHLADIREGDEILRINGWSYKWFSLSKINNLLSGQKNKKVKMRLKRGNEILLREFELRDLF